MLISDKAMTLDNPFLTKQVLLFDWHSPVFRKEFIMYSKAILDVKVFDAEDVITTSGPLPDPQPEPQPEPIPEPLPRPKPGKQ